MSAVIFAIFLTLAQLHAAEALTIAPSFATGHDSNTTADQPKENEVPTEDSASELGEELFIEDNTTSYETNTTNWFFYRDFISGMDTVYFYATDVVVVIGSGIDYSIYRLFSHDNNGTEQADINVTASEDENMTDFPEEAAASQNSDNAEQYILAQKGKVDLPQQLTSKNKRKGEQTYLLSKWLSEKSVNDEFLDRTNHSYIRLRGGYAYNYRGKNGYIYSITARVMIPRTQKRFDLVIGDETKNSADLSLEGTEEERNTSIALGVNNVLTMLYPVENKILVGFSGVTNPYAKIAFNYEALLGTWLVVPHQVFKYSAEAEFEEWTNLDFRHKLAKNIMFSTLFQRSTESSTDGMEYFMQPSVSFSMGWYGNITPYLGIYGRTKEQPEDEDGYSPKRGLYRYAAGINWSRKGPRKYIVYRLQPILSYDDKYEFQPNYYVKALLEFYFGVRD